jgi:redox-sensitive bicupin YhaK (pirin superfamily)
MKKVIHRAESRGLTASSWLQSRHTFSFADYLDRDRINFGAIRVINDDVVQGGTGYAPHPHDNIEVVTIPLEGAFRHEESLGGQGIIYPGQIQVLSAGSGLIHSEYNANLTAPLKFLQIWVFTQMDNVRPRYDDITLAKPVKNKLQLIVAPEKEATPTVGWIHQRVWFYLAELDKGKSVVHDFHSENGGVYLFVISGSVSLEGETLAERDGMGVWETDRVVIKAATPARILLMEVPMKF